MLTSTHSDSEDRAACRRVNTWNKSQTDYCAGQSRIERKVDMAKFHINKGYEISSKILEADSYNDDDSFVHFYSESGEQVFTIAKSEVRTIERVEA